MNSLQVLRRIRFCAGHRLLGHGGKCESIHGHNYTVDISVSGRQTDAVGRVVDFADLKRLFKDWIDHHWDHGFIAFDQDQEAINGVRSVRPHKIYLLPDNPTAENLARHLLEKIGPSLLKTLPGYELKVTRVAVWESADACAIVTVDGLPGEAT
jgi:6-pyruvoyltetrahydropterin/6-carboxytetrahydropterin synthase